ncbi:hypothetical protein MTR67_011022 [Solanum verrucosum]|uniref:Uncharacterized protein n=1 Tax=Solanum verrucosum TaxID=315347 RepID=A0AAF0Q636_SOLVR|nr:hypothetical protein MTR67_011022 [Solanum verrucosum]
MPEIRFTVGLSVLKFFNGFARRWLILFLEPGALQCGKPLALLLVVFLLSDHVYLPSAYAPVISSELMKQFGGLTF